MRALVLLLGVVACVPAPKVMRTPAPTPIAVAYVLDREDGSVGELPEVVRAEIDAQLVERNLVPRAVDPSSYRDAFTKARASEHRVRHLAADEMLLLVEARTRFSSQISGRFRWNVYARFTVFDGKGEVATVRDEETYPALLQFDHEGEADALVAVRDFVAQSAGRLVDAFLGGRGDAEVTRRHDELLYFVLVDRFANGDPKNDGAVDPENPAAWQGGDLAGVLHALDELQELGVTSLWLSPITATQQELFGKAGAFHGYWTTDLTQLEARFGDRATYERLTQALAGRGMGLYLDVVLNHVGYTSTLPREKPEWFHRRGDILDWNDPVQVVTHDVHGLPDLAQEREDVYAYLLAATSPWLAAPAVRGFRLDAVKHVPMTFWRRYNADLARLHPGYRSLAELYDGNPVALAKSLADGGFDAMFDFPTYFALTDVLCGGKPAGALAAVMFADRAYDDPTRLITFLDNHDLPRVASHCRGDRTAVARALATQFALRGVPCLTYGTEAGLQGALEPENRKPLWREPRDPALRETVRRLAELRRAHPALFDGSTHLLAVREHLLAFARLRADSGMVFAVSTASEPQGLELPAELFEAAEARDALSGEGVAPRLALGAGEVRWIALAPRGDGLARLIGARTKAPPRRVRLEVTGAPEGELRLVGLGAELGDWDPARAHAAFTREHEVATTELSLPANGAFAWKLALRDGDEVRWEQGDNRYLFVTPGQDPLRVRVAWR